jgi:hypothetical protein
VLAVCELDSHVAVAFHLEKTLETVAESGSNASLALGRDATARLVRAEKRRAVIEWYIK